ncbi:hypothetical protein MASR2M47_19220 [Draconibacterium sp.]|jgi:hypothetical protein
MQRRRTNRFDNVGIGFLIGFLLPVIVFFVVYLIGENEIPVTEYIKSLQQLNVLIKLGSLCVFVNSVVFMGFIQLKHEKTARGMLGATIIYAFMILISRAF